MIHRRVDGVHNERTPPSRRATAQVAARNRTVQREREAKDRVANATTIRRKSEQIVVETLKPRNDEDSDTATDDDYENDKYRYGHANADNTYHCPMTSTEQSGPDQTRPDWTPDPTRPDWT